MAISWGAWEYSGGNGMRVGIDVDVASVSHGSNSVKFTVRYYTQNQYSYNDGQSLNLGGAVGGSINFSNNSGGGTIHRGTRTYWYNYGSNEYGSSPGSRTFSASLSGAYNGVTPSKSVTASIPARPIADPNPVSGLSLTRISDSVLRGTWNNNPTAGRPYDDIERRIWNNIGGWDVWRAGSGMNASTTSWDFATSANRRYFIRMRAKNSSGYSAARDSGYVQTTPASPGGCEVVKSSVTSVLVRWNNGASTTGGYSFDTLLEEQVDGGAWTQIDTIGSGTTSYNRTGRAPGSVYAYRVRHRSTVGETTYSGFSTSGTIQLQSPPAAPTVVSTVRENDNSFVLNWTNNPNGDVAPYTSLTVQRWDNVSEVWDTIASLGATAVSVNDRGTVTNRQYQWRIAANNAAGSSEWAYFTTFQTRPSAPIEVKAKAAPGGAIRASWINTASYEDYTTRLRYFKNGVLVDDTLTLAPGETSYLLEGVDLTATYQFGVKTTSSVGYTSESLWVDGAEMAAATVPNAPASLAPNGVVQDLATDEEFTWVHTPSLDDSDQTAFEVEYSTDSGATWLTTGKIASTESSWTMPAGTLPNGLDVTWRVRTWGVHETAGPYSPTAIFPTSTTPTLTINEPASGTLITSQLDVAWSYDDAELTPQAHWTVELYTIDGELLEAQEGDGEASSLTMDTVIVDGDSYVLRLRVQDGDGLRSSWEERTLFADFVPPAEPTLAADYSSDSGSVVLTLTPTPDDGGVTTLPATGVDVQRRLMDHGTGVFENWITMAENVAPDATLIDTTAPIAHDGEYRTITYSEAPSARTSPPKLPDGFDDRWVYLSGGANFTQVCRLMGNVALRTTTTRDRSLYNFAGRKKPVMFVGEARTRIIDVAGLLDGESSSPAEWEHLISSCDVMLLRDPLGHRMYGSVPQVAIDHLGNEMYAIAFTVTEVSYP